MVRDREWLMKIEKINTIVSYGSFPVGRKKGAIDGETRTLYERHLALDESYCHCISVQHHSAGKESVEGQIRK